MTNSIETVTKMMEFLPDTVQNMIVEQVRNFIAEFEDESKWDLLFKEKQENLVKAARQAKREISQGKAELMDYNKL